MSVFRRPLPGGVYVGGRNLYGPPQCHVVKAPDGPIWSACPREITAEGGRTAGHRILRHQSREARVTSVSRVDSPEMCGLCFLHARNGKLVM